MVLYEIVDLQLAGSGADLDIKTVYQELVKFMVLKDKEGERGDLSKWVSWLIDRLINLLDCFFCIKGHAALYYRNPELERKTLLLWLTAGDLYSACPQI